MERGRESSTNAASGSSMGSACNMMSLHIGVPQCARRPWPGHVRGKTNLSSGKQGSPECATGRDQGYSLPRAIRPVGGCTRGNSATLPGTATRDLTIVDPRFMVRVRFWQKTGGSPRTMPSFLHLPLGFGRTTQSGSVCRTARQARVSASSLGELESSEVLARPDPCEGCRELIRCPGGLRFNQASLVAHQLAACHQFLASGQVLPWLSLEEPCIACLR
jgi:hypothetical protein